MLLNESALKPSDLPVVCIMGATATGKTDIACKLVDQGYEGYPCEIISVDSALIYKGMNIGTAKPTADVLARYPHFLVDIIEPHETYSAANFVNDSIALIHQIHARGHVPVLVGGTSMYFNSLFGGLAEMPEANQDIRDAIYAEADIHGWQWIYDELARVDPIVAGRLKVSDKQRIVRALEVFRISGQAMSEWHKVTPDLTDRHFNYHLYEVDVAREILHQRIEQRLELMWQAGFMEEVIQLAENPLNHADLSSMRAVGYRQVLNYLAELPENQDFKALKDKALFATRQLAKRQCTWLRKLHQSHRIISTNNLNLR